MKTRSDLSKIFHIPVDRLKELVRVAGIPAVLHRVAAEDVVAVEGVVNVGEGSLHGGVHAVLHQGVLPVRAVAVHNVQLTVLWAGETRVRGQQILDL